MATDILTMTAELVGIPASAISVAVAFIKLRKLAKNRTEADPLRELLHPLQHSNLLIGLPAWDSSSSLRAMPITRADIEAYAIVAAAIRGQETTCDIKSADSFLPKDHVRRMALICGPARNPVTAKLFECCRPAYQLRADASGKYNIVDREGKTIHPLPDKTTDFGIVAKVRNPWSADSDNFAFVAAGIHGLGTLGAAKFMADHPEEILRRLPTGEARRSTPFVGVIATTSDSNGLPQTTELLHLARD